MPHTTRSPSDRNAATGSNRKKSKADGSPGKVARIPLSQRAVTRPSPRPATAPTTESATPSSITCATIRPRAMPMARITAISPRRSFTETVTSVVTRRKPTASETDARMKASCRK